MVGGGGKNSGRRLEDWDTLGVEGDSETFRHVVHKDLKVSIKLTVSKDLRRKTLKRKLEKHEEASKKLCTDFATAAGGSDQAAASGPPAGDPSDPTTWKKRPAGKFSLKLPAWNPIIGRRVKAISKERGRPKRETLGKVWLDWAGEWVDPSDPRAQRPFVNPAALCEMEIRLEKEQQRLAKLQAPNVKPHTRPTKPTPPVPPPRSEYRVRHDQYLQNLRYGTLVRSDVSDVPPTELERTLGRVGKHQDQPRLSALNARRIELYEYKLEQMDLVVCANCHRLRLVDEAPANKQVRARTRTLTQVHVLSAHTCTLKQVLSAHSSPHTQHPLLCTLSHTLSCRLFLSQDWRCDTCKNDQDKLSDANHMDPAPKGRPLKVWVQKEATMLQAGDDLSWLPPRPPAGAHYPPVYYMATLAETLLVTRFRTVISYRHMPLYHKKFRGRTLPSRIKLLTPSAARAFQPRPHLPPLLADTIAFMQNLREFVDTVSVPIKYDTMAFWIVRLQYDKGSKHEDYRVRKAVVIELLKWLPLLLPTAYRDVNLRTGQMIDTAHLESLPDNDSIYDQIPHELYDDEDGGATSTAGESSTGPMMSEYVSGAEIDMDSSGCPLRPPKVSNSEAARRAAESTGGRATRIDWATASLDAECEWEPGYVVKAFPLRFTIETADLNDKARVTGGQIVDGGHYFRKVSPEEYFYHLQWYWDSFAHCYPFANDPRFKYLGHNLSTRRRTLSKATAFTNQLPAGTTREQVATALPTADPASTTSSPPTAASTNY